MNKVRRSGAGLAAHWRTQAMSIESMVFVAMFICLPVSALLPPSVLRMLPSTVLGAILIVLRLGDARRSAMRPGFLPYLLAMFVVATASFVWNAQKELALAGYFSGYVSVLVVYLAVRMHRPDPAETKRALLAFSASVMIPLVYGVYVFHATFGLPDLATVMAARFTEHEIEPYRAVTWGNVNNTATVLAQVMPLFLVLAIDRSVGRRSQVWYLSCVLVCGLNLVIVGSRAAFLVLPMILLAIMYFFRKGGSKTIAASAVALVVAAIVFLNSDGGRYWEYLQNATSVRYGDQSVLERLDSIREGWGVMWEHAIVGVGPGCSMLHISYDAAHQMSVNHGVEFGIAGLVINVLLVLGIVLRTTECLKKRGHSPADCQAFAVLISALAFAIIGTLANASVTVGALNLSGTLLAAALAVADVRRVSHCSRVQSIQPTIAPSLRRPVVMSR